METDRVGIIPVKYRGAIRAELDALADDARPEVMTWVTAYPARLVRQPDLIWSHAGSEIFERDDGTAYGVVPLWTTDETPSDLSVEFGRASSPSQTSMSSSPRATAHRHERLLRFPKPRGVIAWDAPLT